MDTTANPSTGANRSGRHFQKQTQLETGAGILLHHRYPADAGVCLGNIGDSRDHERSPHQFLWHLQRPCYFRHRCSQSCTRSTVMCRDGDLRCQKMPVQLISRMFTLLLLSSSCRLVFVRGNHEELLLDSLDDPGKLPRWLRNGGRDTLRAYRCNHPNQLPVEHLDFVRSSVDCFESERHIFIHAGYVEDEPMAKQSSLALRWRVTNENCKPHCSGKAVIAGHTAQESGKNSRSWLRKMH